MARPCLIGNTDSLIKESGKGETDRGERVTEHGQKAVLKDWHLDLSVGQYSRATQHEVLCVSGEARAQRRPVDADSDAPG